MNNLISSFVGFDGRINRQKWWIGVIVLAIAGFIVSWILNAILGVNATNIIGADGTVDAAAVAAIGQKAGWSGLISSVIFAYPYLALSVKRRHDRNNNGYDAMGLMAVSILYNLLAALGIAAMTNTIGMVIGLILLVLAIYLLVQLGFLKGTAGPNNYGADPLGG